MNLDVSERCSVRRACDAMKAVPSQPYAAPAPRALWRSIYLFNIYWLALGSLFVFLARTGKR